MYCYDKETRESLMVTIRKMFDDGKSYSEIGRAAGVSPKTAHNWLKEEGFDMESERPAHRKKRTLDIDKLREYAEKGYNIEEIAVTMNETRYLIGRCMKENGIKINLEARKERLEKRKQDKAQKKQVSSLRKKCNSCIYRADQASYNGCDYAFITGHSRGCPVIGCMKYVKGKRMKKVSNY